MSRFFSLLVGVAACFSSVAFAQFFDEARDFTRVAISAVRSDPKTSAQGGCGTNGCRPELIYDDNLDVESRWSCQQPYDPDSYDECFIFFNFHEPQHMAQIQIAFLNGDTRQRTVVITYDILNDDGSEDYIRVGSFTSSGTTAGFEEISIAELPDVATKGVYQIGIGVGLNELDPNEWLSILEVKLEVFGVYCEDSNPNQSCEPDAVEDRLSAERYLYQDDEELWELLVNGKGIGLCNIRVAGAGEETDLYAYSGVLNDEGNHGYPGMHDGYVSTPDWPSGSPDAVAVCADYETSYGDKFCGSDGRTNAIAQMRNAISSGHCCLSL